MNTPLELYQPHKPLMDQLCDAVHENDTATAQHLVGQIHEVPGYVLNIAVRRTLIEQIAILAPKCSEQTIRGALSGTIMGNPYINMPLVHALLPYVDPTGRNYAMVTACKMGRAALVEHLYPLCDIETVLHLLHPYKGENPEFWTAALQERVASEKLRDTLNAEVSSSCEPSKRKM